MWIKRVITILLAYVLVPTAIAQSDRSIPQSGAAKPGAIQDYIIQGDARRNLNAVLQHLSSEVRAGNSRKINLNITLDGNVIVELIRLDMFAIQKAAIQPYMIEICDRLDDEEINVLRIADLFTTAFDAETNAIVDTFDSITSKLRDDAYLLVQDLRANSISGSNETEVDWVRFSEDHPTSALVLFKRACSKFEDPSYYGDIPMAYEGLGI